MLLNHKVRAQGDDFAVEAFSSAGFTTFTGWALDHVDILGFEDHIANLPETVAEACQRRFGTSSGSTFDPDDFMAGREPKLGLTVSRMQEIVGALDPSMGREPWVRVGMALHHECEGDDTGFDIWDDWSMDGDTYPGTEALRYLWESFKPVPGKRQVTMASVIKMAKEAKQKSCKPLTAPDLLTPDLLSLGEPGEGRTPDHFEGKFPIYRADDAVLSKPPKWLIKSRQPRWAKGGHPAQGL